DDPNGPLGVFPLQAPRGRVDAGAQRPVGEARLGRGAGGGHQAAGLQVLERGSYELFAYVQACSQRGNRARFVALAPQQQQRLELLVGVDVLVKQRAHILGEIVGAAHERPEGSTMIRAGTSGRDWGTAALMRMYL